MKKLLIALVTLIPSLAFASVGGNLLQAPIDPTDQASLQNGAKLFMNYCSGCHDTSYQRYNRVAKDLGIPKELMMENLVFTGAKFGDLMFNAVDDAQGSKWFGGTPPDLTLVSRSRGNDWVYTYLKSFYADPERPFGVNNTLFKDVGMPHVLQDLQGLPTLVEEKDKDGRVVSQKIVTDSSGEMNSDEFDIAIRDITNFLNYAGEPSKLERESLGKWVLGFLFFFFILCYFLKKEYWRDVH